MLKYAAKIVDGLVIPDDLPEFTPHAFPKSPSPIIVAEAGQRIVQIQRWGVGYTVKGKPTLVTNARDDQLLRISLWKESTAIRRCLVPVVGYFEPGPGPVGARGEVYFTMRDRPVFFIAGLWDTDADGTRSYAMVTTSPNAYAAEFHDRQPVILSDENAKEWVGDRVLTSDRVAALTRPPANEAMQHQIFPAIPRAKKVASAPHDATSSNQDSSQGTLF